MTDERRPNERRPEGRNAGSNRPRDRAEARSADRGPLVTDGGLSVSECLEALADRRRRYVLYYLREDERAEFEDLTERVAAWETETAPENLDEATRRQVRIDLVHAQLPRLEELGMIRYDHRRGIVQIQRVPNPVEQCLERCSEVDFSGDRRY